MWLMTGQHLQHDRVGEAEDGDVRSYAERERQRRDAQEDRRLAQEADASDL